MAAATKSRAAPAARRGARKGAPFGLLLLMLLTLVPLAFVALPTTILLVAGMLPTLIAFLIDRDPNKLAALTVGPVNFAGLVPAALGLWSEVHSLAGARALLSDPMIWLVAYGAAGLGWLLYFGVPGLAVMALEVAVRRRIRDLAAQQERLVEEWGEAIRQAAADGDTAA